MKNLVERVAKLERLVKQLLDEIKQLKSEAGKVEQDLYAILEEGEQ